MPMYRNRMPVVEARQVGDNLADMGLIAEYAALQSGTPDNVKAIAS